MTDHREADDRVSVESDYRWDLRRRAAELLFAAFLTPGLFLAAAMVWFGTTKSVALFAWVAEGGARLAHDYLTFIGVVITALVAFALVDAGTQLFNRTAAHPAAGNEQAVVRLTVSVTKILMAFVAPVVIAVVLDAALVPGRRWSLLYVLPTAFLAFALAARVGTLIVPDRAADLARTARTLAEYRLRRIAIATPHPARHRVLVAITVANILVAAAVTIGVDLLVFSSLSTALAAGLAVLVPGAMVALFAVGARVQISLTFERTMRVLSGVCAGVGAVAFLSFIVFDHRTALLSLAVGYVLLIVSAALPEQWPVSMVTLAGVQRQLAGRRVNRVVERGYAELEAAAGRLRRSRPSDYA